MQSTPKGEFKVLEIVKRETIEPVYKKRPASKLSPAASSRPERGGRRPGELFGPYLKPISIAFGKTNNGRRKASGKSPTKGNPFPPSRTVALEGVRQARAFDVGVFSFFWARSTESPSGSHTREAHAAKLKKRSVRREEKKIPPKGSPGGKKTSELSRRPRREKGAA